MAENKQQINVKVNKITKEKAQKIFEKLGINLTSAINLFLSQSVVEGGLPFKPNIKLNCRKKAGKCTKKQ